MAALPRPGDEYKAHSRVEDRPQLMLAFVRKDLTIKALPYANLEDVELLAADEPGGGVALKLRFAASLDHEIEITGRKVHDLFDLVRQQKVA